MTTAYQRLPGCPKDVLNVVSFEQAEFVTRVLRSDPGIRIYGVDGEHWQRKAGEVTDEDRETLVKRGVEAPAKFEESNGPFSALI